MKKSVWLYTYLGFDITNPPLSSIGFSFSTVELVQAAGGGSAASVQCVPLRLDELQISRALKSQDIHR